MAAAAIVVFLSTGRCGTQWLTANLRELHPELAVEHEPIGPLYRPRRYLRCTDVEAPAREPEVAAHLERVAAHTGPYVETGWPLFSAIPLLARRFASRLRVVHLTRHPVPSALSHLAHGSYAGSPRDDAYTRWATLGPSDPGVLQTQYATRWPDLSPYEKCLFWWTEVHAYALELPHDLPDIPFLRVDAESMLAGDASTLQRLLSFLALPYRDEWQARARRVVDRWQHHTAQEIDPRLVLGHSLTCAVAQRLGYDPERFDARALRRRYVGRPDDGADRFGRFEPAAGSVGPGA